LYHGSDKYPSLVERFQGYCVALIEAGMSVDPRLVQPSISEGFPNKGYREMKALLAQKRPFDAVFCVSDRAALGALQALQEASIRVPEEMGIAGFEDVPQAAFSSPPLTTVKMPKAAMGKAAIRQIVRMIRGGSFDGVVKIVLPPNSLSATQPPRRLREAF
jgi:LacI family transcriptional regulator